MMAVATLALGILFCVMGRRQAKRLTEERRARLEARLAELRERIAAAEAARRAARPERPEDLVPIAEEQVREVFKPAKWGSTTTSLRPGWVVKAGELVLCTPATPFVAAGGTGTGIAPQATPAAFAGTPGRAPSVANSAAPTPLLLPEALTLTHRRILRSPRVTTLSPAIRPSALLNPNPVADSPHLTPPTAFGTPTSPASPWLASGLGDLPLPPLPDPSIPLDQPLPPAQPVSPPFRPNSASPAPPPRLPTPSMQPHSPLRTPGRKKGDPCLICLERELAPSSEVLRLPCGHGQFCYPCGVGWVRVCCNGPRAEQQPDGEGRIEKRRVHKTVVCPLCRDEVGVEFEVEVVLPDDGGTEMSAAANGGAEGVLAAAAEPVRGTGLAVPTGRT
ncbi:hypothetical protein DFJ74DRAFT_676257 [Hyaloraphidium curvatum]|nr:hypothetical protein DFJ74DRAFT_676257 [Hyaloraphidium curvatum]